jgi:hypothetical protein
MPLDSFAKEHWIRKSRQGGGPGPARLGKLQTLVHGPAPPTAAGREAGHGEVHAISLTAHADSVRCFDALTFPHFLIHPSLRLLRCIDLHASICVAPDPTPPPQQARARNEEESGA